MKVLIVAATPFEIEPLVKYLGLNNSISTGKLVAFEFRNLHIDILITGVGMVATAFYMGKYINRSYDMVINAGICGSFNNNLGIGAVVNVVEDCFSELGAEDGEQFLSLSDLKLPGLTSVINNTFILENTAVEVVPKVNGITVNTVHGHESSINKVVHKYHPIVESMEGAAFMFACQETDVQYIQLRAVSNYVERRNRGNWNIPLAIENLNKKLIDVIETF